MIDIDLDAVNESLTQVELLKALRSHSVSHVYTLNGLVKGEGAGHPFHGNQHGGGGGSYAAAKAFSEDRSARAEAAGNAASKSGNRSALLRASELHGHAVSAHRQAAKDAPNKIVAGDHLNRAAGHDVKQNDLRNRAVR